VILGQLSGRLVTISLLLFLAAFFSLDIGEWNRRRVSSGRCAPAAVCDLRVRI
jgi:hypothetical protein